MDKLACAIPFTLSKPFDLCHPQKDEMKWVYSSMKFSVGPEWEVMLRRVSKGEWEAKQQQIMEMILLNVFRWGERAGGKAADQDEWMRKTCPERKIMRAKRALRKVRNPGISRTGRLFLVKLSSYFHSRHSFTALTTILFRNNLCWVRGKPS